MRIRATDISNVNLSGPIEAQEGGDKTAVEFRDQAVIGRVNTQDGQSIGQLAGLREHDQSDLRRGVVDKR